VSLLAVGIVAVLGVVALSGKDATEERAYREAGALLGGIPQRASTLGSPSAPVTLDVFLDLKDPDSRTWFLTDLPAILREYVRPGTVKLEYRAYKTNTFSPQEFVKDQTATLAAGTQNKLWNFLYIFYIHQGSEFARYATKGFLENIARLVPGLNLTRWDADRRVGRREEQTTAEDQATRALGLHVTPSFRIGKTGGPMTNFSGHAVIKYGEQHPISYIEAKDLRKASQVSLLSGHDSSIR
jgi:hypothetical protein